jgi:uncharacterized membrane protein YdjX (TVP38/TMEM64 family)
MTGIVRVAALVLVIMVLLAIPALLVGNRFDVLLDGAKALEVLRAQGMWAWAVAVGLICADLVIPVPSPAIMAALGLIYGALGGGAIAAAASFLAALIGYGVCRLIGPGAAKWIVGDHEIGRLSGFFERYGFWAIALSRWLPAVPEVLACLAGMTRMTVSKFLIANLIGSLAVGFAYAWFGARGESNPAAALAAAAILPYLALPLFLLIFARRKSSKSSAD